MTRALALLVVELALSATANDYRRVGRAVREAVAMGLGAEARWPLLPEVLATVLMGKCVGLLDPIIHSVCGDEAQSTD